MKEAEKALETYLEGWLNRDWLKMYKASQLTWRSINTRETIEHFFEEIRLEEYDIKAAVQTADAMILTEVILGINGRKYRAEINAICEARPYEPDAENGQWGINPISSLKLYNA